MTEDKRTQVTVVKDENKVVVQGSAETIATLIQDLSALGIRPVRGSDTKTDAVTFSLSDINTARRIEQLPILQIERKLGQSLTVPAVRSPAG